jgi:DNA-binding response OmpR family regulator
VACVLVVDDELLIAEGLKDAIEDAGHEVVTASSFAGACRQLRDEVRSFQAVVTDINLGPGGDGFDVASHARARHPGLLVAYTSGRTANLQGLRADGALTFSKPFNAVEVARQVDRLIRLT